MRSRQLGMSPAKIAIAVAVTMEAMAGTGGMKKVTGTSSAVAMVAVRPLGKGHPGTAVPRARVNQPRAADAEADRDQPRKPCRPELLPRHLRKSLDMPEQHRREREQGHARDGVIDFQATWRGRRL